MTKPGKLEPYSYLPLNPKLLNRRHKQKAAKQFNSFVGAAKKGSSQGQATHQSKRFKKK